MTKKFIIISAKTQQGFFANFLHILQWLEEADRSGKIPIVHWEGGIYSTDKKRYNGVKTKNVWEYFFEPASKYSLKQICPKYTINKYGIVQPRFKSPDIEVVYKYHFKSLSHEPQGCWDNVFPPLIGINNPDKACREYINSLICKHIKIKQVVQDQIDTYYNQHMKNNHVLGVQIRGCSDMGPAQGQKPIKR
ncbi:hypothetical protein LCGC14_0769100, partial [marine sediment metagenome]